jgi:hypothetical protein
MKYSVPTGIAPAILAFVILLKTAISPSTALVQNNVKVASVEIAAVCGTTNMCVKKGNVACG